MICQSFPAQRHTCFLSALGVALICLGGLATHAFAWTQPIIIQQDSTNAQIAPAADGGAHTAYHITDYRVWYARRDAAGNWTDHEQLANFFSFRPAVIEDAQGRPHVIFPGDGAGDRVDMYHSIKIDGSWQRTQITTTSYYDEDEPQAVIDSAGKIHLIYTRAADGPCTVIYRVWDNGSWSSETSIISAGNSYYQRPDISIDSADNLHVIVGTDTSLLYRKKTATGWQATKTLLTDGSFIAFPKIAAPTTSQVMVVTFDQIGDGQLRYGYSNDGGSTWTSFQYMVAGHWPNLDKDDNGNVHAAFHWLNTGTIGYMLWNGSSWSSVTQPTVDTGDWQGWPDIAALENNNELGIVYDYLGNINFVSNFDPPPASPTNFTATPGSLVNHLSWTNPADEDFEATMIRYRTDTFPTGPDNGSLLAYRTAEPGSADAFDHTTVTAGTTYYYAAFAIDAGSHASDPAQVSAMAHFGPDFDDDGDVDQSDFGIFQLCLSGTNISYPTGCERADFDTDGDVDKDDTNAFIQCLSGSNTPYDASCLP